MFQDFRSYLICYTYTSLDRNPSGFGGAGITIQCAWSRVCSQTLPAHRASRCVTNPGKSSKWDDHHAFPAKLSGRRCLASRPLVGPSSALRGRMETTSRSCRASRRRRPGPRPDTTRGWEMALLLLGYFLSQEATRGSRPELDITSGCRTGFFDVFLRNRWWKVIGV